MLELALYLATTTTLCLIAKRHSKQIFRFTARISRKTYLDKFFKFLATVSTQAFKWLVAGKVIEEIGSQVENKPLKTLGNAIALSSSFILRLINITFLCFLKLLRAFLYQQNLLNLFIL